MSVGFTGTQRGMTEPQKKAMKRALKLFYEENDQFHHGDCIGADSEAHQIAREVGYFIVLHPPTNSSKRAFCKADKEEKALPYLERNLQIVKSTQFLLATPKGMSEERRSGTWSTIRKAKKMGRKIMIIFPNGQVQIAMENEE